MPRLACLLLAGCWSGAATTPTTHAVDVSVMLASVTLADDCGEPVRGSCAPDSDCRPPCEQTSMQLSLHAGANAGREPVRIERVELLDAEGHLIGELAARTPRRWTNGYVSWDETIAPNQTLVVSYPLATPDWSTLGWDASGKTFQLRVTVAIGGRERTIEKQAITPTMLEPPVVT